MADVTVIHFTSGRPATVALSLDDLHVLFDDVDANDPFVEVPDTHGGMYVINVGEIVSLEGTSTPS